MNTGQNFKYNSSNIFTLNCGASLLGLVAVSFTVLGLATPTTCRAASPAEVTSDPVANTVVLKNMPDPAMPKPERGKTNDFSAKMTPQKSPRTSDKPQSAATSASNAEMSKFEKCDQTCEEIKDGEASEKAYSLWPKNVRLYCSFDRAVQETVKEMKTIPGILKAGYGSKNIYFSVESAYGNVIEFKDWRDIKPNSDCIK